MLSWTNMCLYGPHTFIIYSEMHQMCLLNQSNVLNVILKQDLPIITHPFQVY